MNDNKSFELDGIRPIESNDLEVAETFEEDGTRPIAESPDFLVRENNPSVTENPPIDSNKDVDEKRPEDSSEVKKVVDTFEEDGTRPIMSNKYEVIDTIKIDGDRPITSE